MIVTCPGCKRSVLPKSDQSCPGCGRSLAGAPAAAELSESDLAEQSRLDESYQAERKQRRLDAESVRSLGLTLFAGGILLVVLAVGVTVLSYSAAGDGGSYSIWSGGVVAGAFMTANGWARLKRARRMLVD
jgi:hypothetical protein